MPEGSAAGPNLGKVGTSSSASRVGGPRLPTSASELETGLPSRSLWTLMR